MKKLLLFSIILLTNGLFTQGQITWEKLFSNKNTDVFRSVQEVPSGGYIIAGYTSDSTVSDSDAYVVRMTTMGDTLWTYRQNIGLSKKDLFYKVINTLDGGFAMCGYTSSVTGLSDDVLIVKIDGNGQHVWTKTWGGSGKDRAQDIIQLSDGSYVLCGYTTSSPALYYDAFMYKLNSSGDSLFFKRYGTAVYDDANSIKALSNGGFILGGQSTNGANGFDQYLIRTNDSGDTLWTRKFGTLGTDNIECLTIGNGGFYLTGGTNGAGVGGDDGYLVKTDTSGSVLWTKTFGGSQPDDFHRVELTSDGGLILSGTTSSTGPLQPNMWLMRTNSTGDSLWSRAFGGDNHDHGYSAVQTLDGGFIFVGHTSSFGYNGEEGYVVKTDGNGDISNLLTYTAVTALVNPISTDCGSTNVQVKVIIRNFGRDTVPNVPGVAVISGSLSTTLNQTYNGAFHPQDADTLVFLTTINTLSGGTYTFNLSTQNNNDVFPARNSMTVTITIEGVGAAPVTTNGMNCGTGTVSLSATSSGTVNWYTASSGGSPIGSGTTFVTPSISSSTTYYAQTGLNCPSSRTSAVATINPIPTAPTANDVARCGNGTVNLTASSSNTIEWYSVSSGGSVLTTGTTYTTPSLSSTTPYYVQAVDPNTCVSARTTVNAIINSVPADPTTTNGNVCGSGNATTLQASGSDIIWYDDASGTNQVGTGNNWTTPNLTGTTTYYAQSFNGTCGSGFIPATATVVGIPSVYIGPDTAFETGTLYVLDAGAGFTNYSWNAGPSTQTLDVIFLGTYCVTVTDGNGCTNTDCAFVDFFVGTSDLEKNSGFSVYPNPAKDHFKIAFNSSMENVAVSIVDLTGKLIYTNGLEKINSGYTLDITTAELSSGVYFIQVKTNEKTINQKLIVE